MKIVFMGTPEFAIKPLDSLIAAGHEIVAVVSQPDRAKNRKGELTPTPIKKYAIEKGLPVYQFEKIKKEVEFLRSLTPDVMVTAAYGQLLSEEVLSVPKLGVVNVHASLLPRYRGSSPIQSALLAGDEYTGVTLMMTELSLDSGDIIASEKIKIEENDNVETLSDKLSVVGAKILPKALSALETGQVTRIRQNECESTKCVKIAKEDGRIDFSEDASVIFNKVRAFKGWPSVFVGEGNDCIKIIEVSICPISGECGTVLAADDCSGLIVACGKNALRLRQVQPAGKKQMTDVQYMRGHSIKIGDKFGQ